MNPPEHPGAPEEFAPGGSFQCSTEPRGLTAAFQVAFQPRFQQIQHARHCNKRRSAFALHRSHDFTGVCGWLKNHSGTKKRWNKQRNELAKNVTKRDQRHKPKGMKPALVIPILL